MGECYIDDAETIAEDGVDPAQMFTIWESGFKKVWKGESESEGKTVARVDLHPTGAEERSFHTIQCFIDPELLQVVKLQELLVVYLQALVVCSVQIHH